MILNRQTVSLCPTCYKEVPATVRVGADGVWMTKVCSEHGMTRAMVERDPVFYMFVSGLNSPSIYDGYFIDVTRQCNLRCTYCYYPLEKKDPEGLFTIERLVQECAVNVHRAPFIFTGGEPTFRPDIVDLVKAVKRVGPVEMLTNGVRLADPVFYDELMPELMNADGTANLNLSIHDDQSDKWRTVIETCRRDQIRIESALIVVDSKERFFEAVKMADEFKDVVMSFRIKAATRIWNEQKPEEKIFVSDMMKWLEETGKPMHLITQGRHTKSVFLNVLFDGAFLMLLSWHDVTNVDLPDINCAPWYRARNGQVLNFVTAALVNEGMAAGYLCGNHIVQPTQTQEVCA